jgi:hypothetical protein
MDFRSAPSAPSRSVADCVSRKSREETCALSAAGTFATGDAKNPAEAKQEAFPLEDRLSSPHHPPIEGEQLV